MSDGSGGVPAEGVAGDGGDKRVRRGRLSGQWSVACGVGHGEGGLGWWEDTGMVDRSPGLEWSGRRLASWLPGWVIPNSFVRPLVTLVFHSVGKAALL